MNIAHYTYRVTWSPEDQEYVGLCAELPLLSWLSATQEAALQGIRQLVSEVVIDLQNQREPVPAPLSEKRYSGEFKVRTLPHVHQALALQAAELKVSLNRLVNQKLME